MIGRPSSIPLDPFSPLHQRCARRIVRDFLLKPPKGVSGGGQSASRVVVDKNLRVAYRHAHPFE